jgi:inhibitor of KinA
MFEVKAYGDRGLRIQFGETISEATNTTIRSFSHLLEKEAIPGVIEWIPTYVDISILYDPYLITYKQLKEKIYHLKDDMEGLHLPPRQIFHIPVYYGGEAGPDLEHVAAYNGLTPEEVIEIHTNRDYLIYMIGFTPGFPYLGGMSEKIATPRLKNPRSKTPAGSVGIAGVQTGIYSMETPGGWQIIGKTPVKLYDIQRKPPVLLQSGHSIRFEQVTKEEYKQIEKDIKNGRYQLKVREELGNEKKCRFK